MDPNHIRDVGETRRTPKRWRDQSIIMFRRCRISSAPSQRRRPAGSILPLPCAAVTTIKSGTMTWHWMISRKQPHCLRGGKCQCHFFPSLMMTQILPAWTKRRHTNSFSRKYSSAANAAKRIYNSLFIR